MIDLKLAPLEQTKMPRNDKTGYAYVYFIQYELKIKL